MRKDIPGYEGLYQVDVDGNIYSLERVVRNGKQLVPAKRRAPIKHSTGYLTVTLCKDSECKMHRIHRLVAMTFLPRDSECGDLVNHINGCKTDNRLENLEWCSAAENTEHAIATGLMNQAGFNNQSAKVTPVQAKGMLWCILHGMSIRNVAAQFDVSRNTVSKLLDREYGTDWRVLTQKPQYRK